MSRHLPGRVFCAILAFAIPSVAIAETGGTPAPTERVAVSGRVLDGTTGGPIEGAKIEIFDYNELVVRGPEGLPPIRTILSAPDGSFSFETESTAALPLVVSAPDRVTEQMVVSVLGPISGFDVVLEKPGTVTGRITSKDGLPLRGARIAIESSASGAGSEEQVRGLFRRSWRPELAETGEDGRFEARHIPAGRISIASSNPQSTSVWLSGWDLEPDGTIDTGRTVLEEVKTRRVSGRVVDERGRPLSRRSIWVIPAGFWIFNDSFEMRSDASGRYSFDASPAFDYFVAPVPVDTPRSGRFRDSIVRVETQAKGATRAKDVVVPAKHVVSGKVIDALGHPAWGCDVRIFLPHGSDWRPDADIVTDREGIFLVELPASESYKIVARHPNLGIARMVEWHPAEAPAEIHLEEGETLRGKVSYKEGGGFPRLFSVHVSTPSVAGSESMNMSAMATFPSTDGKFEIRHLPPGKLLVRVADLTVARGKGDGWAYVVGSEYVEVVLEQETQSGPTRANSEETGRILTGMVAIPGTRDFLLTDRDNGRLYKLDLASRTAAPLGPLFEGPLYDVETAPDGRQAYVLGDGILYSVDVSSGASRTVAEGIGKTVDLAISPDGRTAYALTESGTLVKVDTASGERSVLAEGLAYASDISACRDGEILAGGDIGFRVLPADGAVTSFGKLGGARHSPREDPATGKILANGYAGVFQIERGSFQEKKIAQVGETGGGPGTDSKRIAFVPGERAALVTRGNRIYKLDLEKKTVVDLKIKFEQDVWAPPISIEGEYRNAAGEERQSGFRSVTLSGERPKGVKRLPPGKGRPLFGSFKFGTGGKNEVTLVLQRGKAPSPAYGALYVDRNRNGDLTDDGKPGEAKVESRGEHTFLSFDDVEVAARVGLEGNRRKSFALRFEAWFLPDKEPQSIAVLAAPRWEGSVGICGGERKFRLTDMDDEGGLAGENVRWALAPVDGSASLSIEAMKGTSEIAWAGGVPYRFSGLDSDGRRAWIARARTGLMEEEAKPESRPPEAQSWRPRTLEKIKWLTSFEDGKKAAREEKKPLFVFFTAKGCGYCTTLEEDTFTDGAVMALMRAFVLVKIDAGKEKDLVEKLDVTAYPTLLFESPEGKETKRESGFQSVDAMTTMLRSLAGAEQAAAALEKKTSGWTLSSKGDLGALGGIARDEATGAVVVSTKRGLSLVDAGTLAARPVFPERELLPALLPSADGKVAFVVDRKAGEILRADLTTGEVAVAAKGLDRPIAIAAGAEEKTVLVAEKATGKIVEVGLEDGGLRVVALVPEEPSGLALDPERKAILVRGAKCTASDYSVALPGGEVTPVARGEDAVGGAGGEDADRVPEGFLAAAALPGGRKLLLSVAGVFEERAGAGKPLPLALWSLPDSPSRVAFAPPGRRILALAGGSIWSVDLGPGDAATVLPHPVGGLDGVVSFDLAEEGKLLGASRVRVGAKLLTLFDLARGQIRDEFEMGHVGIVRIERDERGRESGALLWTTPAAGEPAIGSLVKVDLDDGDCEVLASRLPAASDMRIESGRSILFAQEASGVLARLDLATGRIEPLPLRNTRAAALVLAPAGGSEERLFFSAGPSGIARCAFAP